MWVVPFGITAMRGCPELADLSQPARKAMAANDRSVMGFMWLGWFVKWIFRARLGLSIERPVILAGAEIGSFQVGGAEGGPGARAEDAVLGDVVHVNRDPQHRCEREVKVADVAAGHHAVVRPPVVHHLVGAGERSLAREDRRE